jgi:FkbM family methyltransferase
MFWLRIIKLIQIIIDPFFISALIKGAAAGTEHRMVLQGFNFDFIVDVGANRGQFALISSKIFPRAKIHSFEPLEEPAQIFQRIFGSDPNVILHTCAIGREKTTATIHVTKDDDSSSLLPITKIQSDMSPGTAEKETRQVMVYPLSQVIDPASIPLASLLKIDVQGYELDVLQGCEDILQKFSYLYVECSFVELYQGQAFVHEVISYLNQFGLILTGVYNLWYDKKGIAIQADFLFKNKKPKD